MSKCQVCGKMSGATVLVKVQWFGRGTKWLCVDCVRLGEIKPQDRSPGDRRSLSLPASKRSPPSPTT